MLTPSQLKEYLSVLREAGATRFEQEGLLIELAPQGPVASALQAVPMTVGGKQLTEDDWLFAASEGLPTGEEKPKNGGH